ncbi:hypothetical protein [Pseudomonas sp.]|uniref:hypothetical protein n=1 Tax=Pseudomonas sp. TaxID=306 RepID=UPI003D0AC183
MHTSKYSRNKAQNIQNAILAIEMLKSEGKRPTAKAISEISGISVDSLYSYEELRGQMALNGMGSNPRYPRVTKGVRTAFGQRPMKANELYKLKPAVGSYVSYLIDNYFSRPESISTVQIEMSYDIENFSPELFKQAVNLLVKDKVLLRHAVLVDLDTR